MCAATAVQVVLPVPLEMLLEKRHCGCKDARLEASRLNAMNAEAEDNVKRVVVLFRMNLIGNVNPLLEDDVSLHGQVDNVDPSNCSLLPPEKLRNRRFVFDPAPK